MPLRLQMADRKIVEIAAKNVEVGEIEEGKKETLNGKNVLFKLEGFLKQSKVERK